MTAVATLATVVGFVAQFVGLRALHWSATIYQLGVMLIMTIARSVVRRGLAEDPVVYRGDIIIVDGSATKQAFREVLQALPIVGVFNPVL